jgi:hypothetical protein
MKKENKRKQKLSVNKSSFSFLNKYLDNIGGLIID